MVQVNYPLTRKICIFLWNFAPSKQIDYINVVWVSIAVEVFKKKGEGFISDFRNQNFQYLGKMKLTDASYSKVDIYDSLVVVFKFCCVCINKLCPKTHASVAAEG